MESGKINYCITKDLSRLGRNAIDTGYYITYAKVALSAGLPPYGYFKSESDKATFAYVM